MLLQITYQEKATQTEKDTTMEELLKTIATLCTKVDSMGEEIKQIKTNLKFERQSHDSKHAELCQSEDEKIPEIEGDVGKLPKTHNICSITTAGTSRQVSERQHKNINLNKLFEKPFTPKISKNLLITKPQTSTYIQIAYIMTRKHITISHVPI